MATDKEALSAGGYLFLTEKDVLLARAEEEKIKYLEERIDYSSSESILYVYEKVIHERMFKTPVGLQYLKRQQDFLRKRTDIDQDRVIDIPLYVSYDGEIREHTSPVQARIVPSEKKDRVKAGFTASVILNVMLVFAIIAMFYISFVSENPNMINYERALTDKYSAWDQELTEREQAVREKERELKLQP